MPSVIKTLEGWPASHSSVFRAKAGAAGETRTLTPEGNRS